MTTIGKTPSDNLVPLALGKPSIASEWMRSKTGEWQQLRVQINPDGKLKAQILRQNAIAHFFRTAWGVRVKDTYNMKLDLPVDPLQAPQLTEVVKAIVQKKGVQLIDTVAALKGIVTQKQEEIAWKPIMDEADRQIVTLVESQKLLSNYPGLVRVLAKTAHQIEELKGKYKGQSTNRLDEAKAELASMKATAHKSLKEALEVFDMVESLEAELKQFNVELMANPEAHEARLLREGFDWNGNPAVRQTDWVLESKTLIATVTDAKKTLDNLADAKQCQANLRGVKNSVLPRILAKQMLHHAYELNPNLFTDNTRPLSAKAKANFSTLCTVMSNRYTEFARQIPTYEQTPELYGLCQEIFATMQKTDNKLREIVLAAPEGSSLNNYLEIARKEIQHVLNQLMDAIKEPSIDVEAHPLTVTIDRLQTLYLANKDKWTTTENSLYEQFKVLKDVIVIIINADVSQINDVHRVFNSIQNDYTRHAYLLRNLSQDQFAAEFGLSIAKSIIANLKPKMQGLDFDKPFSGISAHSVEWLHAREEFDEAFKGVIELLPRLNSLGRAILALNEFFAPEKQKDQAFVELKALFESSMKNIGEKIRSLRSRNDLLALSYELQKLTQRFETAFNGAVSQEKGMIQIKLEKLKKLPEGTEEGGKLYREICKAKIQEIKDFEKRWKLAIKSSLINLANQDLLERQFIDQMLTQLKEQSASLSPLVETFTIEGLRGGSTEDLMAQLQAADTQIAAMNEAFEEKTHLKATEKAVTSYLIAKGDFANRIAQLKSEGKTAVADKMQQTLAECESRFKQASTQMKDATEMASFEAFCKELIALLVK